MLFMNSDGSFKNYNEAINSFVESYNKFNHKIPGFSKHLTPVQFKESLAEIALLEYSSMAGDIGFKLGSAVFNGAVNGGLAVADFDELEGFKLDGDITHEPQYKSMMVMIQVATNTLNSLPTKSKQNIDFLERLFIFESLISELIKIKPHLVDAIKHETSNGNNKSNTIQLVKAMYATLVISMVAIFSAFYSESIKASFDESTNKLKSYSFEYDRETNGDLEESLSLLNIQLQNIRKGKYLSLIKDLALDNREPLKESLNPLRRSILNKRSMVSLLEEKRANILNENIADLGMAFITSNMITDAILIPIYFIRYLTYLFKYGYHTISHVNENIKKSLDVLKNDKITKEQFVEYKTKSTVANNDFLQRSSKASELADDDIKKDKAELKHAQENSGNTIII